MEEDDFIRCNEAILRNLGGLPEIGGARTIHAYWPIEGRREIDLRPFLKQLQAQGKQIVLPVVLSFAVWQEGRQRLEHRIFEGETNLKPNRWEVLEPAGTPRVDAQELDAIIVPALAADRRGYRLGYGKGFYDEFLAACNCPLICPLHSSCLMDRLPVSGHDVPVDLIVTELEVIRVKHT